MTAMSETPTPAAPDDQPQDLCASDELTEGGLAFGFDVLVDGEPLRAFAVRFEGQPHAYLNRCTHVSIELDMQPGKIFDDTGQWLLCASHGAAYAPDTGACAGGPCTGGLLKIALSEEGGRVRWHPSARVQPVF